MLLMREGFDAENQTERPLANPVNVDAGTAGAIVVKRGQLLKITAQGDGAVASLFGFSLEEPNCWLSVHHTRVFSNSYLLGSGMRLVSNRRRPMLVLGKDSIKKHDLLLPASTTAWLAQQGYTDQKGCVEAVEEALQRLNIQVPKLPDPINLFMHVDLKRNGALVPQPNKTKAGDYIISRVVTDMLFIVSACCTGIEGNDKPAPLWLSVSENLTDMPS